MKCVGLNLYGFHLIHALRLPLKRQARWEGRRAYWLESVSVPSRPMPGAGGGDHFRVFGKAVEDGDGGGDVDNQRIAWARFPAAWVHASGARLTLQRWIAKEAQRWNRR